MKLLPGLATAASLLLAAPTFATTITPTFGAAKAEAVDQTALCANTASCVVGVETYNTRTTADFSKGFTTDFGTGGAITGTYVANSGANLQVLSNDLYGGAVTPVPSAGTSCTSSTCRYPELYSGSYTLSLSTKGTPGVNYFGLWISALDANNDLKFYSGSTLLYDFTPTLMAQYIQMRSDAASYKGNPATGEDAGEYFSFVNFFANDGTFDSVVFSNSSGSGFESDNATVAYRTSSAVFGNAIPEPGSLLMLVAGLAGLAAMRRRATLA